MLCLLLLLLLLVVLRPWIDQLMHLATSRARPLILRARARLVREAAAHGITHTLAIIAGFGSVTRIVPRVWHTAHDLLLLILLCLVVSVRGRRHLPGPTRIIVVCVYRAVRGESRAAIAEVAPERAITF